MKLYHLILLNSIYIDLHSMSLPHPGFQTEPDVQNTPQPKTQPDTQSSLSADFWEGRYQEGSARWDLGQPAPPFVSLLQSDQAPSLGRMAVLGSGRGHDALLFAAYGFEVIGFDFAPSAVSDARTAAQRLGYHSAQFLERDIFGLAEEFTESFDYVLEHTCFCAILPAQRSEYLQLARQILRPGGEVIGLFWAHERPGGPPFGIALADLKQQLQQNFIVQSLHLAEDSVEGRRHEEYLARLQRRLP